MCVERALRLIGGGCVMASVLAGMYVSPHFYWFTLFVGLNLFQAAFTGTCPTAYIMKKAGMRPGAVFR